MSSTRIRVQIDTALWNAAQAVAKARKMDPGDLVSEALRLLIGPAALIETAAELTREHMVNVHEIADRIRVISDFIVDHSVASMAADQGANDSGTGRRSDV